MILLNVVLAAALLFFVLYMKKEKDLWKAEKAKYEEELREAQLHKEAEQVSCEGNLEKIRYDMIWGLTNVCLYSQLLEEDTLKREEKQQVIQGECEKMLELLKK